MGATDFMTKAPGKSASEAFRAAQEKARYDHGHAGYTGTIAEKGSFVMVNGSTTYPIAEANVLARSLVDNDDPRVRDKWGPAGCVRIDDGSFLFFGLASC